VGESLSGESFTVSSSFVTLVLQVYYDIFTRHAFGNYKDIMREVSFSPVMGDYLTYRNSRSFNYDFKFPDENFAREIMQLFSIGLWKLGPDGQRVRSVPSIRRYGVPRTWDWSDIILKHISACVSSWWGVFCHRAAAMSRSRIDPLVVLFGAAARWLWEPD
jgi:hypothetical protein